jgi:hypothetical protein
MSVIPTSTKGTSYYSIFCHIYPCGNGLGIYLTNEFEVSVVNCVVPPINTANIKSSYSYFVQSFFSHVLVLSNYVSPSTTDCTYNYTIYFSNGTLWMGSSPFSFATSSGILTIT